MDADRDDDRLEAGLTRPLAGGESRGDEPVSYAGTAASFGLALLARRRRLRG